MELFETLAKKRACRAFSDVPVSREQLDKLIYAVGRAPTASNRPYRHCVVVDDPGVIRAIQQISPSLNRNYIPMLLIIFTDEKVAYETVGPVAARCTLVDAGAAGENVLLGATALGLGSQFTMIAAMAGIRIVLGLPDHCRVDMIIPIGNPIAAPKSVKASKQGTTVYHNRYGPLL